MKIRLQARVVANFGEAVAAHATTARALPDESSDTAQENHQFEGSQDYAIEPHTLIKAVPLKRLPLLVAGDYIVCEGSLAEGVTDLQAIDNPNQLSALRVTELITRNSVLTRPDRKGGLKPLASNLSQLVIVCAANPPPDRLLIDQFCVVAGKERISALIVFNKADLLSDNDPTPADENICEIYQRAGLNTVAMSTSTGLGFEKFCAALESNTSALVGQSGVGKSSIVSRLLPDQDIRVGEISRRTGLGAHTTTVSFLYSLGDSGTLIDSPGVRQFSVSHLAEDDIVFGFPEIARLATSCRFANCRHDREPDCAVKQGVSDCEISKSRFSNYSRLLGDVRSGNSDG